MRLSTTDDDAHARMKAELVALGEALSRLRQAQGLSQAEAGARIGMTGQGWGLYESGRRAGLFRPDIQTRLAAALEASPEDIARERAMREPAPEVRPVADPGVAARGQAFRHDDRLSSSPERFSWSLQGDEVWPWAAPGVVLICDPGRWPRRGQGCVLDMTDGETRVRLFDGADADHLHLRGGPSGLEDTEVVPRARVSRLSTVVARNEP